MTEGSRGMPSPPEVVELLGADFARAGFEIDNVTIDFIDTLTHTGFKFDNPNASSQCSCGSSFSV